MKIGRYRVLCPRRLRIKPFAHVFSDVAYHR